MKTTLLIATYNWPEALRVCIKSVFHQSELPAEIVIADDGSDVETRKMVEKLRRISPVPIIHIWHPDNGFRKTIILNKAVRESSGDYIIQVDGDVILHPRFIEDHLQYAEKGFFIKGGRALLNKRKSEKFLRKGALPPQKINLFDTTNRFNSFRCSLLSMLFCRCTENYLSIRGCNMAYWKEDYIKVNGYNNDITGWGYEDRDLAVRLHNSGLKMKCLKFKAIEYHLHHDYKSREDGDRNFEISTNAINKDEIECKNGYCQTHAITN